MMITQTLKTSLLMKQEEILILRENDKNNQIKFLFNDLTDITSAEFRLIKPDDTFVIVTGEIDADDNSITFDVDEQMCAISGNARFNIRLIGDNMNVYTYVSRCIIDINLDLDNAIESVAEVNGLVFPDDFLTSADLSQYATKSYVNEAIAEVPTYTPPNYSTTEQDTGLKWIDGKHIYQKTIDFGNLPDTTEKTVNTGVSDIESLVNIDGVVKWPSGQQGSINSNNTDNAMFVFALRTNGYISCTTYMDRSDLTAIITIKYTKTTDTV